MFIAKKKTKKSILCSGEAKQKHPSCRKQQIPINQNHKKKQTLRNQSKKMKWACEKSYIQVRDGEVEGSERVRSFGRSRLRRRKKQKLVDESTKVLLDWTLLELSGHEEDSSQTKSQQDP